MRVLGVCQPRFYQSVELGGGGNQGLSKGKRDGLGEQMKKKKKREGQREGGVWT